MINNEWKLKMNAFEDFLNVLSLHAKIKRQHVYKTAKLNMILNSRKHNSWSHRVLLGGGQTMYEIWENYLKTGIY
jgi:hypothetical protein